VREAIFGILGSLAVVDTAVSADGPADGPAGATAVEEASVADLFAGSGALGIEALSRGAGSVVFVDVDRQAVATIRENIEALGLAGPRATVVRTDAVRWLRTAPPTNLVLADPPYAYREWPDLLTLLEPVLGPAGGLAVLESGAALDLGPGWEVLREKHYGGTVVTVARPARSLTGSPPEPVRDQEGDT
jgi:16S rRNA (guanine966-N2)-methyltransferase